MSLASILIGIMIATTGLFFPLLATPTLLSVQKIWDNGQHCAFTDLVFFQDRYLCVFRESDSHAGGVFGKIRILSSVDGIQWTSNALLTQNEIDLRDPKISVMPNGTLMLVAGAVTQDGKGHATARNTSVAFSHDGQHWTPFQTADIPGEWVWRVTWHEGTGYATAYRLTDLHNSRKPWELKLFTTTNAVNYTFLTNFDIGPRPNEATIRFTRDEQAICLARRDGVGLIGTSYAPYRHWEWKETLYRLGGPNFLILPNGEMWACSRTVQKEDDERTDRTTLFRMSLENGLEPVLDLPSGGDCSYPGMVYRDGKLYISYYSSHETESCIYFAVIALSP